LDIIFINELKVDTVIGIYDWEKEIRQTLYLDLEMAADVAAAARSDSIESTVDYKAVSKRLADVIESRSWELVETLAETCAQVVREEFSVPWVRLRVNKKGALSRATDVGVLIERGRWA
jgi:dihydroneopterin aldolase